MRGSSWKRKEFSRRRSRLLPSRPGARGPWAHSHPRSPAHLLRSTCGLDARPRPHARPEPRPWGGRGRAGAAEARPHARPSQSGAAVSDVGLRAAASGPRGGGTGSRLGLPARSSAARPPQAARPGGRAGRGAPRPSARPAMQGPSGNASHRLPGGPPSTVASGAGRCESGALMHSFGIFLQGLLGVVAFSTLMRESWTPTPPEALWDHRRPSPASGNLLPEELRPGAPGPVAGVPSARERRLGIPRLAGAPSPDPGS